MASSSSSFVLAAAKEALRKDMKKVLKGMSEQSRAEQSAAVARKVLSSGEYRVAKGVAIYLSMKDEVDTFKIMKNVFRQVNISPSRGKYLICRTLHRAHHSYTECAANFLTSQEIKNAPKQLIFQNRPKDANIFSLPLWCWIWQLYITKQHQKTC